MQYMNPHVAVHTIYLDEKSVPRYRSNRRPLPRYAVGGDILFFCGQYALSWQLHKDFFFYVKDRPELLNPHFVPDFAVPSINADPDDPNAPPPPELPSEFERDPAYYNTCLVGFPVELRIKEMTIQEVEARAWEKAALNRYRDKCMRKMYEVFTNERGFPQSIAVRELSVRFKLPTHTIRRMLRMSDLNAPDMRKFRQEIKDPRLERVYKVMLGARSIATAKGLNEGFGIKDVLPYHPGTTDQYIPPKCPVLGLELEYDEDKKKQLNAVRVGRKQTNRPYGPGNLLLMSFLATRLIEGSLGQNKAALAADHDIVAHWREWSRDHVTNWGKTKLGRPSKKKDKAEEKT